MSFDDQLRTIPARWRGRARYCMLMRGPLVATLTVGLLTSSVLAASAQQSTAAPDVRLVEPPSPSGARLVQPPASGEPRLVKPPLPGDARLVQPGGIEERLVQPPAASEARLVEPPVSGQVIASPVNTQVAQPGGIESELAQPGGIEAKFVDMRHPSTHPDCAAPPTDLAMDPRLVGTWSLWTPGGFMADPVVPGYTPTQSFVPGADQGMITVGEDGSYSWDYGLSGVAVPSVPSFVGCADQHRFFEIETDLGSYLIVWSDNVTERAGPFRLVFKGGGVAAYGSPVAGSQGPFAGGAPAWFDSISEPEQIDVPNIEAPEDISREFADVETALEAEVIWEESLEETDDASDQA